VFGVHPRTGPVPGASLSGGYVGIVRSPLLPRCLPPLSLTPTQWFRYHWRYTTSTPWDRSSRRRSLREKPHWQTANLTAVAEAAESLGRNDVARLCRQGATAQEWATARLALRDAWKSSGEPAWKLDEWLTRRTFQVLDGVSAE
jgi:hypothetical protein